MKCKKYLTKIKDKFLSEDHTHISQEQKAYLKYSLKTEKKRFKDQSLRLETILSSDLGKDLGQKNRKLLKIQQEYKSFAEQLGGLEQKFKQLEKLNKKKSPDFIIVIGTLLFMLGYIIVSNISFGVIFGISSILLVFLYIYTYKYAENQYIYLLYPLVNPKLLTWLTYAFKWLCFIVFLILEAIIFIHWKLTIHIESGYVLAVPLILNFLGAVYLGLIDIHKLLPFQIIWPKSQLARSVIYGLYLMITLFVFLYIILFVFSVGDKLSSHEFLQAFASGVIVSSILTTLGSLTIFKR